MSSSMISIYTAIHVICGSKTCNTMEKADNEHMTVGDFIQCDLDLPLVVEQVGRFDVHEHLKKLMMKRTYVFTNKLNNPVFAVKVTPLSQNSQIASLDITLKIEKVTKLPQSAFAMIMSQNRGPKIKFLTDNMEKETFKKSTFAYLFYTISFSRQWTRKHLWHHRNYNLHHFIYDGYRHGLLLC
eukprot:14567385-Ditylum_brightwellii.AAC.2